MVRSFKRSRQRCQHHPIEALEARRLLYATGLTIDMRIDVGNAANTDPASIVNAHTISNPKAGDVYAIQIWAESIGTDTNDSNSYLDLLYGSLIASDLRTGGYFGAVQGTFAVPTLEPYFASSTYQASAGEQYTDSNGNTDIGTTDNNTLDPQAFFHPVADTSQSAPPTNYINQGQAGAGEEEELGTTTFTVNSVVYGPPTTLEFQLRPQITGEVSAIWYTDGQEQDTYDGDTVNASTGITVTEPDTIDPTATTTLQPILGSTPSYQFTVNYSDNQDLNLTDFQTGNILVSGPGFTGNATYVSDSDAAVSSNPQYDPYNAVYQITPTDGSWSLADNGTYTFTLQPNQIADNTGNYAASTVIGTLDVAFTGAVSIAADTSSISENSTTPTTFTVTRTGDLTNPMTVNFTASGTATAGTNYDALGTSVTIPAGAASAQISVQPIDDNLVDNDTNLTLTLAPGSTYVYGSTTSATLTIANTDVVTASISDQEIGRPTSDTTYDFMVTLSQATTVPIVLDYSTTPDTAVDGTDYNSTSGVLTIPAGATSGTIGVDILAAGERGDRTFDLNITPDAQSADEVTVSGSPAVATISDIIPASLSPLSPTVSSSLSGGTAQFTVTLETPSSQTVTVNYATADGSAAAGTDYTATSGTLTFAPGATTQTFSVPLLPVIRSNAGKAFTVTITPGTLSSIMSSQGVATVTLQAPSFVYLPIDPKKGATYTDASGNKVTVKVSGVNTKTFIGNVLFPTGGTTTNTNAVGITLDGTTAASTLTITTHGTTLDFIDVNGSFKAVTAKGVNLAQSAATSLTPYYKDTGTTSTITLGNLNGASVNGAGVKSVTAANLTGTTINFTGATAAKMTYGNIQDSEITDAGPVTSFSATQWLNTDSTADLLSIADLGTLNIKGTFEAAISTGTISSATIKGAWTNSLIEASQVKKMSVGTATNSELLASVNPNAAFPPASSDLAAGGQITSFTVTSKAAHAFSNTRIEAQYMGTIVLGNVNPSNNGSVFGVASEGIKQISGSDSKEKFNLKSVTSQAGVAVSDQDFVVEMIA